MTDRRHIPQEDFALFAMGGLTKEESAEVRDHAARCSECRAALAQATSDLSLVAMSVEQRPVPEGARRRFLDRIGAAGTSDAQGKPRGAASEAGQGGATGAARVIPMHEPSPAGRRSRWPILAAWGAVAALLLLSAGLELRVRSLQFQLSQQAELMKAQNVVNARARAVLNLLTAPDAKHVMLTAANSHPAPMARAVYLPSQGALMLQASHLGPVPANKTYELWIMPMHGGAPMPAGMFRPDAAGNASIVMPDMPRGIEAKALGVTIENAGGSATPTMPIVLEGEPSSGE